MSGIGARRVSAGSVRYRRTYVPNRAHRAAEADLYSAKLRERIRIMNVAQWRVVHFDGRRSRVEEINCDYGVRSRSLQFRRAGNDTVTYCKELRHLAFCVRHPVERPVGGPPPALVPTGETATIAGMRGRQAEYHGDRHLLVWYTDEVEVCDPTGAVLSLDGVPGLVLQTRNIPATDRVDALEQVTLTELSDEPPPPEILSEPDTYRLYDSVDAARAEDRRILDERTADELRRRPLRPEERETIAGEWLLETTDDRILVQVTPTTDDELRFRTTVLTAPDGSPGRVRDEQARRAGRLLLVEDPPNYRLYRIADAGRRLIDVDNELFTFTRSGVPDFSRPDGDDRP
ncbi:MAG TPA: hypothetical protein VGO80_08505 [Solirubrobacteraceae bacterium]|nr:hypothetical protein [Solirubrobacteraceae bacterium]